MGDCFLFDALRTPRGRGKANGSLHTLRPIELAATPLRALRQAHQLPEGRVDDVIMGCVEPVGEQGGNLARIAALMSGLGEGTPGMQINRFCSSGLDAINLAAAKVMAGQASLCIGGGVESMSRLEMGASGGPWATDPQVASALHFVPQGISADLLATRYGYSREACDRFALRSQEKAAAARHSGRDERGRIPVTDRNGITLLDQDEHPRPDTKLEGLAALKPSFKHLGERYGFDAVALQRYPDVERIQHRHHAGNSSGIVDGAAAALLGDGEAGEALQLKPRAIIRSFASVGSEPCMMLDGPVEACRRALSQAGLSAPEIDLWEINEAFSAVVLRVMDELAIDGERVNVNGGAIALGHPLGATGAMLVSTLLHELERQEKRYGLVTLCVGAGMGTATVIERLD
ncbi:MAG: acetyl-CoA acetyltransferase [Myxococcales bacterium]|nr:acetyl-CoA acetyltransferase [Myxococcales bacterium]